MKNLKNYSFALMLGIGACGFMASCSSDDDVKTEVVTGNQEALNAACKQWRVARAHWEKSEAFLFGAADEYSIDPHTDTWPVDQAALANVLRDQSIMSDIENKVRLLNSGLLGYHGIEYVLFRQGNPRDISQLTDLEYQYVCAVAKDLYQATCVLQTTWEGAKSGTRYNETLNYLKTHNKLQDDGNVSSETSAVCSRTRPRPIIPATSMPPSRSSKVRATSSARWQARRSVCHGRARTTPTSSHPTPATVSWISMTT